MTKTVQRLPKCTARASDKSLSQLLPKHDWRDPQCSRALALFEDFFSAKNPPILKRPEISSEKQFRKEIAGIFEITSSGSTGGDFGSSGAKPSQNKHLALLKSTGCVFGDLS